MAPKYTLHRKVGSDVSLKVEKRLLGDSPGQYNGHCTRRSAVMSASKWQTHQAGQGQRLSAGPQQLHAPVWCTAAGVSASLPGCSGYTACRGLHADSTPDVGPEHLLVLRGCADGPGLEIVVQHGGGCNHLRPPGPAGRAPDLRFRALASPKQVWECVPTPSAKCHTCRAWPAW